MKLWNRNEERKREKGLNENVSGFTLSIPEIIIRLSDWLWSNLGAENRMMNIEVRDKKKGKGAFWDMKVGREGEEGREGNLFG